MYLRHIEYYFYYYYVILYFSNYFRSSVFNKGIFSILVSIDIFNLFYCIRKLKVLSKLVIFTFHIHTWFLFLGISIPKRSRLNVWSAVKDSVNRAHWLSIKHYTCRSVNRFVLFILFIFSILLFFFYFHYWKFNEYRFLFLLNLIYSAIITYCLIFIHYYIIIHIVSFDERIHFLKHC